MSLKEKIDAGLVSIHAPVKVRPPVLSEKMLYRSFNSRTREGATTSIPLADGQTGFNSRTREGATFPEGGVSGFQKFQFTHP